MGWFEGQATREKKAAVKNVLAVMAADGQIDKRELAFVALVCKRVGLNPKHLKELISASHKVQFTVPEAMEERVLQLIDMVFMMMADGKIDPREMDLCMTLASRMGFPASVIPDLVKKLVDSDQEGSDRAQVAVDIGSFLGK